MPTLTVKYIQMPVNHNLPGGFSAILTPNQTIPLSAPDLAVTNPAPPPAFTQYHALFWNISGAGNGLSLGTSATAHIQNEDVVATAWYYAVGGGPGPSGVTVFTFSESQNLFLNDNPIESVTATGYNAVANPMWVPTGAGDVQITPKAALGSEDFSQWLISGAATVLSGNVLHEHKGLSDWAIACYQTSHHHIQPINPELLYLIEQIIIELPDPGDPATIDLYRWLEKLVGHKVPVVSRPVDDLSILTKQVDKMKITQLRTTLAALKAQSARILAAQKLVETAMKNR
jgi:hypothetical protein